MDDRDIDLEQMMDRIRSQIHEKRLRGEAPAAPGNDQPPDRDMAELDRAYDLTQAPLDPNRRFLGWTLLKAAKAVSQLLRPVIRRQSEYNAANTRLMGHVRQTLEALGRQMAELRDSGRFLAHNIDEVAARLQAMARRLPRDYSDDLRMHAQALSDVGRRIAELERGFAGWLRQAERIDRLEHNQTVIRQELDNSYAARLRDIDRALAARDETLETLQTRYAELAAAISAADAHPYREDLHLVRGRILRLEHRLRRLLAAQPLNGDKDALENQVRPANPDPVDSAIDYAAFEETLRDSQAVREKQRVYVKYFAGRAPVIDIGCGKGEFLELMREAGIEAKGLDLNPDMILQCREKGLAVQLCDGIEYLGAQPDGAAGGIFSAQVIEHLTPAQLNALVTLAWRKLRAGGILVLETLNPESLWVHYKWFWMDPSHVRLVHPQTLRFLLDSAGFAEISTCYASPPDVFAIPRLDGAGIAPLDEFNRATDYLNKILYASQEYALIATK